jgi:hypothetical protein
MLRVARNRWGRRLLVGAHVVGLLAGFYCYVLLRIRPELFYLQKPAVFLRDYHFFADFMDRPGGPVEYAAAFLSPLFAYDWLGALVVTLLVTLISLATRQLAAAIAGVGDHVTYLVPPVLILLLLGQYSHPVELCVGLVVVLALANAYVGAGSCHKAVRLAAFLIASALAYYATAGLYLVFACLCAVFELGVKRYPPLGVFCAVCAGLVPLAAGVWLFDLNVSQAYRGLMPSYHDHWLAVPSSLAAVWTIRTALVLCFPVAAIVLAWRRGRVGLPTLKREDRTATLSRKEPTASSKNEAHGPVQIAAKDGDRWNSSISPSRLALHWAALVALVAAADFVWFDSPKKCLLEMVSSAEHGRWADVLMHVRRVPPSDPRLLDVRTAFHVNRALYFHGDLLDRMFGYPQTLDGPTLCLVRESATIMAQSTPRQCSEVFFQLGRINESEHMAYEALEIFGDRPRILKRLIYINAIRGRPEAARRFLAVLERSLLHGRWARRCRRQLDADPTLSGVPGVASRRERMVVRDSISDVENLESMLQGLLERNPRNRMAFEYLMAHYLLTRQLDKLASNLHRFDDFGAPRLPRHCEEAMVLYLVKTGSREVGLGQRAIGSPPWRRYGEFVRALQQFSPDDASEAFTALHGDFGDTYFFFCVFGSNHLPSR